MYTTLERLFRRGSRLRVGVVVSLAQRDAARRLQRVALQFLGLSLEYLGWVPFDRHVVAAVRDQQASAAGHRRRPAGAGMARRLRLPGDRRPAALDGGGRAGGLFY